MINVVCAVIENSEGDFLVCQRPLGKDLGGRWEFPGGKIEKGEGEREALQREIGEELGCDIVIGEKLITVQHDYPNVSVCLMAYHCLLKAGDPKLIEHSAHEWVNCNELAQFDWVEADIPIWQKLVALYSSSS